MWGVNDLENSSPPSKVSHLTLPPSLPPSSLPDLQEAMKSIHQKMLALFKACEQLVNHGKGSGQRQAYVMFTDLLVVFGRHLRRNPQVASLVYSPPPSLQQTLQVSTTFSVEGSAFQLTPSLPLSLQDYVMDYVMNSSDDDDIEPASDEEALVMAERLNDRRILLAAFLKLTMFQVIEAKMAAPIWGHLISVSYTSRIIVTSCQLLYHGQLC